MIARIVSATPIVLGSAVGLVGVVAHPAVLPAWAGIGATVGLAALVSDQLRENPPTAAARRRTAWLAGAATTVFLLVLTGSITLLGPGAGGGLALLIALGCGTRFMPSSRSGRPGTPGEIAAGEATTARLCRAWQQSWFTLSALPPGPVRARVADLRGQVLDELERRHPDGIRRWLESGPRANETRSRP
jgi:hypothetical protein